MMFASAPTSDGQWYAVRLRPDGRIVDQIPGLFENKAAADGNARHFVGPAK